MASSGNDTGVHNSEILECYMYLLECCEITPKNIIWKIHFLVNNQYRRYCKMHMILYPKTNLKRKKIIKTVFREI